MVSERHLTIRLTLLAYYSLFLLYLHRLDQNRPAVRTSKRLRKTARYMRHVKDLGAVLANT